MEYVGLILATIGGVIVGVIVARETLRRPNPARMWATLDAVKASAIAGFAEEVSQALLLKYGGGEGADDVVITQHEAASFVILYGNSAAERILATKATEEYIGD